MGRSIIWKRNTLKILVTGGAGFIGSHTTDALIKRGYGVRILDNLQKKIHPKGKPDFLNDKAEFIQGDVTDKSTWQKALKGVEAVYHFAAYQDYLTDFSTFFRINTVSTALLYEIIVEEKLESKIRKVIVATSQAVMGEGKYRCLPCSKNNNHIFYPQIRLARELSRGEWDHRCPKCRHSLQWMPSDESVINACNQYAISKYSQEQIALQFGKRYQIPSVVMRYSIVQGPRQSFYNAYSGAMRIFALSLFFDKRPIIFEDGKQIRDFINIKDVVNANLLVLKHEDADYRVFNVGGDKAWTVADFYHTMERVVGKKKEPIISGYYRYGDTRHIFSDTNRLKSIGWKPTHGIEESIGEYWKFINAQKQMNNILSYAEKQMKKHQIIRRVIS